MPRTILIVEDSDLCRDALEMALMEWPGVDVCVVATAEEALLRLKDREICALVTDLRLVSPQGDAMDGFELIAAIRSHPRHASLPVVVISGDSHPGLAERLLGLRVDAFFAKPYSPSAVRSKLEQLIFSSEATTARTGATEADRGPNRASHQSPSIVLPQPPERKAG